MVLSSHVPRYIFRSKAIRGEILLPSTCGLFVFRFILAFLSVLSVIMKLFLRTFCSCVENVKQFYDHPSVKNNWVLNTFFFFPSREFKSKAEQFYFIVAKFRLKVFFISESFNSSLSRFSRFCAVFKFFSPKNSKTNLFILAVNSFISISNKKKFQT